MPIRNAPSQIPTTLRFMGSRLAHRMRGGGHVPVPDFRGRVELAVQALGDEAVLRCDWITVQPGAPP